MDKKKLETIADIENKKRFKAVGTVIALAGGAILLSFGYTAYNFFTATSQMSELKPKRIDAIKKEELERNWKTHFERKVAVQSEKIMKLERRIEKLEKGQSEITQKLDSILNGLRAIEKKQRLTEQEMIHLKSKAGKQDKPTVSKPPVAPPIKSDSEKKGHITKAGKTENRFYEDEPVTPKGKEEVKDIIEFKPKKVSLAKKKKKDTILRIPMGFALGLTLSGSDFPTLQYGRNNPHPVFISIADKELIANNKRLNLKDCLVIGSGWGELSSERAYILLDKISCTTKDGRLLEAQVKGWIMDDDGKVGLRGRLVTKQGAYLGKSIIAGFLSGISKILSASATTVQISPVGTTSTINPQDALKVGMYSGVGSAAERLAKFYEKMAEEIFPVIEVNGGRRVVIAFDTNGQIRLSEKRLELNPLKDSQKYELGSIKFKKQVSSGGKE